MTKTGYRIAVIGAGSLLGKEIGDELADSPLATGTILLLDTEETSGTLESVGDEATFLQTMEPAALDNVDVAIFADARMLKEFAGTAKSMGAAVVDATGTSAPSDGPIRSLVANPKPLSLETSFVRVAHPVTTMLALATAKTAQAAPLAATFATVLQPASENGRAALDELQQQSIHLLNFQAAPTDEFDTQVAFNLTSALGESAKHPLAFTEQRVLNELQTLVPATPEPILQWLHAPVFHGFTVSLFLQFTQPVSIDAVNAALSLDGIELVSEEGEPPSNLLSAGQGQVLAQVKGHDRGYAVWMAADNLKLTARTAVYCALELTKLRPLGTVQ